jgi:hypothetical protein
MRPLSLTLHALRHDFPAFLAFAAILLGACFI